MNNSAFIELTPLEKAEFIGKLVIAAQNDFFGECSDIINKAQQQGLFERVKPLLTGGGNAQMNDLNNPIENGIT